MKLLISFGFLLLSFASAIAQEQTAQDISRRCVFHNPPEQYEEGERFEKKAGPLCFICTCVIENGVGIGQCQQQTAPCAPLDVPAGCTPEVGACGCITGYSCPDTEICKDPATGNALEVGETVSNDTCHCMCVGNSVGEIQCECEEEPEVTATAPPPTNPSNDTCIPDPNVTCQVCVPSNHGMQCTRHTKCDAYDLRIEIPFRSINRKCVCVEQNRSVCNEVAQRKKRFAENLRSTALFNFASIESEVVPAK